MRTFRHMTLPEFDDLLLAHQFTRRIDAVHLHHTWRPNHSQYRGYDSIVSMWRHHTEVNGWSDIAQHLTIAPDGVVWTGRSWNLPPCSASGHNGNRLSGPFMIEVIGDFDIGQDPFEGPQREAVYHVICAIQARFELPVESLRFHNEMSPKTCPGSSLTRGAIMDELRRATAESGGRKRAARKVAAKADRPFDDDALAVHELIDALNAAPREKADPWDAELVEGEDVFVSSASSPHTRAEGRGGGDAARELTPEMLRELRPHVVNLAQGQFSTEGRFQTDRGDVDAIFEEHLPRWVEGLRAVPGAPPPRVLFYAHGGLVSEEAGLWIAYQQVRWWKANDVYPIFFVWETGLLESIKQLLLRNRDQVQRAVPRDLWDYTTDPIIEGLCRVGGGLQIWAGIKRSAERASAEAGGARYVAERLTAFVKASASPVELHAIGHSAGSIFQAHFAPMVCDLGASRFTSMHFLAPALRVDAFLKRLAPILGKQIPHLTVFTMNKDLEQDDDCARVYRKSLLYLIHHALEADRQTPLLGLEVSLRRNAELKRLFGLNGQPSKVGEVIWSKTSSETGRSASRSTSHGGFDNDSSTMNSIARRVLALDDTDPLKQEFPLEATRGLADIWSYPAALPEELRLLRERPGFPVSPQMQGTADEMRPAGTPWRQGRAGTRRALCIGIDAYATAPLAGCVADARAWSEVLRRLGFGDQALLLNGQATRTEILAALTDLVTSSKAGDVVVFQFAGHGTTLPDLDGDEQGGDTPDRDEALCPIDFADGRFVIDDDVSEVFRQLPDGVNLTCFIDCCHSGTISRFAIGGPSPQGAGTRRARYLVATPAMVQGHRAFREGMRGSRSTPARGPETMREVVFSACLSNEVAWESGGHGEFTVRATDALRGGIDGMTNEQFQAIVSHAFGAQARQHPLLDCAAEARRRGLLQPLVITDGRPAIAPSPQVGAILQPLAAPSTNGQLTVDPAVLAQLLKTLTTLLDTRTSHYG